MTEYTRPATWEGLTALARALEASGARYALIGGYAVGAHGNNRFSEDVDLPSRPSGLVRTRAAGGASAPWHIECRRTLQALKRIGMAMFFQRIKTPGIAHAAYVLGNEGEAVVVDPRRDIDEYLSVARDRELTITHVLETHRQEDFVMGSAELARVTGGKVVNGRHELFGHGDVRLDDGEDITIGGLRLRALHTPGHTPESMCYAVFLPDAPSRGWGVFSGDTLFIGETGRTDLPDRTQTARARPHRGRWRGRRARRRLRRLR